MTTGAPTGVCRGLRGPRGWCRSASLRGHGRGVERGNLRVASWWPSGRPAGAVRPGAPVQGHPSEGTPSGEPLQRVSEVDCRCLTVMTYAGFNRGCPSHWPPLQVNLCRGCLKLTDSGLRWIEPRFMHCDGLTLRSKMKVPTKGPSAQTLIFVSPSSAAARAGTLKATLSLGCGIEFTHRRGPLTGAPFFRSRN